MDFTIATNEINARNNINNHHHNDMNNSIVHSSNAALDMSIVLQSENEDRGIVSGSGVFGRDSKTDSMIEGKFIIIFTVKNYDNNNTIKM